MRLLDKLFHNEKQFESDHSIDGKIVAMADGKQIDISTVSDPVFAQQVMGKTLAFQYEGEKLLICSPANGTLTSLFPTGHAFGITMINGIELLVHIGIDTIEANGNGFSILACEGDNVKIEQEIVEVDLKELKNRFDMTTMIVILNDNGQSIEFINHERVKRGQSLIKKITQSG